MLDRETTTPSVVLTPGITSTVAVTAADGYAEPVTVSLEWATLSAYAVTDPGQPPGEQPQGTTPPDGFAPSAVEPVGPGTAVLDVALRAQRPNTAYGQPDWGHYLAGMQPLPGLVVTFTPTRGTPVAAQLIDETAPSDQTGNDDDTGLLGAIYRFTIPDTATTGTLSIAAATTTGLEYQGFEATGSTTVTEASGVSDQLTFPPIPSSGPRLAFEKLP